MTLPQQVQILRLGLRMTTFTRDSRPLIYSSKTTHSFKT